MIAKILLTAVAVLVAGPAAVAQGSGDPTRGEEIYERCIACHSIDRNRAGPKHGGLFGRRAGTIAGFRYSEALRQSGVVWTDETLDGFLKAPRAFIPGTRMGYAGIKNDQERADLIAYLKRATEPDP